MDKKIMIAIGGIIVVIIAVVFAMSSGQDGLPSAPSSTDNYDGHGHAH